MNRFVASLLILLLPSVALAVDPFYAVQQDWHFSNLTELGNQVGVHPGYSAVVDSNGTAPAHYWAYPSSTFVCSSPHCVTGQGVQWADDYTVNGSFITSLAWSSITGKPTTLSGYGITDGVNTSLSVTTSGGIQINGGTSDTLVHALALSLVCGTDSSHPACGNDSRFTTPGSVVAEVIGGPNVNGTSSNYARSDHVHALPGVATTSAAGFESATDKVSITSLMAAPVLTTADTRSTLPNSWVLVANENEGSNSAIKLQEAATGHWSIDAPFSASNVAGYYVQANDSRLNSPAWNSISGKPNLAKTYAIYGTGATAQWVKIGTFGASQGAGAVGRTVRIVAYIHAGYNATNAQDSVYYLQFKTSSGVSVDANGFAGNGSWYAIGYNSAIPAGAIKWKGNAAGVSATSYDLFISLPQYTEGSHYSVTLSPDTTWTDVEAGGQSDPGAASSMVLIPDDSFNSPSPFTSIVFASTATAPQITQTEKSGTGNQFTVHAQDSSSGQGGSLNLQSGDGTTGPGAVHIRLGSTGQALDIYDSSMIGGADSQIISYLPFFFEHTSVSASTMGAARFGFDNQNRIDPSNSTGRDLRIEAESLVNASSTAGNLWLYSGTGIDLTKTGSIHLMAGTTEAMSVVPGGGVVQGNPGFTTFSTTKWAQATSTSTSPKALDITDIQGSGVADGYTYTIDYLIQAKGGAITSLKGLATFRKASGSLNWLDNVVFANASAITVAPSAPDANTIRLSVTPPATTSTTWTLKAEVLRN